MDFYTKFKELNLPDNILFSWLKFDASMKDDGPNSNDPQYIDFGGEEFNSNNIGFKSGYLEFENITTPQSFSVFMDFEKEKPETSQSIISSFDNSGNGFSFGCSASGRFFIFICKDNEEDIRFFKNIHAPKRSMLLFKKEFSTFSLGLYQPETSKVYFQSFNFSDFTFDFKSLQIGKKVYFASDSDFKLYDLAIIENSVHGFLENQLAKSMNEAILNGSSFLIDKNNLCFGLSLAESNKNLKEI